MISSHQNDDRGPSGRCAASHPRISSGAASSSLRRASLLFMVRDVLWLEVYRCTLEHSNGKVKAASARSIVAAVVRNANAKVLTVASGDVCFTCRQNGCTSEEYGVRDFITIHELQNHADGSVQVNRPLDGARIERFIELGCARARRPNVKLVCQS